MDRASQALAEGLASDQPKTYAALSEKGKVPRSTLYHRARGRRSKEEKARSQQYLTPWEEKALAKYLIRMSDIGYPVRIKYVSSLALIIAYQRSTTHVGIKPPGKNWPKAFELRHPELHAKKVKAVDWNRHDNNIYDKITLWFEVIGEVLQDPAVLPENVYNMDETGVMLSMLGSVKVLVSKNDSRNYRGAGVKRIMVTAIECVSADGRALLPMIIWPAITHRSNWTVHPTIGWHYACSESGYTDSIISLEWLKRVFDAQTKARAQQKPRILICDGFGTHETLEVLEYCFQNNILLCRLPSHTSHKLQPCDIGVFGPLKAAYRDQVERLYRGGANTVGKEHFTYLYSSARDKALTSRNIKAGWSKAGLFPFNPLRVLGDIQKPSVELTVPIIDKAECRPQDEVLLTPLTPAIPVLPATPVTPITADALTTLHSLIEQDAHARDETSKQRLQRRLQKLANAAQISFAERALLADENRLLFLQNNEAKVRRSNKSTVVEKAKIMSYEDIEDASAKRAAKEQAKVRGKGKRGRKRKSPVLDVGVALEAEPGTEIEPEPKVKLARISKTSEPTRASVRMSELQIAPVARMY